MFGRLPVEDRIETPEQFKAWLQKQRIEVFAISNVVAPMVQAGIVRPEELNVATSALQKIRAGDPGLSTSEREIVERMHAAKVPAVEPVAEKPKEEKSPLVWIIPAGLALRFLL